MIVDIHNDGYLGEELCISEKEFRKFCTRNQAGFDKLHYVVDVFYNYFGVRTPLSRPLFEKIHAELEKADTICFAAVSTHHGLRYQPQIDIYNANRRKTILYYDKFDEMHICDE